MQVDFDGQDHTYNVCMYIVTYLILKHHKVSPPVTPPPHFLAFEQACDVIWSPATHPTQVPDWDLKIFMSVAKGPH